MSRLSGRVLCAVALSASLAACGSSSDGGKSDRTDSVDKATAQVKKYADPADFSVEALASTPPSGKRVAWVNCNVPSCNPGAMDEPAKALGWSVDEIQFDVTKGPQDLTRAFDQAIASKPDYISVTMLYPEKIVSDQLAKAKAAGIPIVNNGGRVSDGFVVVTYSEIQYQTGGKIAADIALDDAGKKVRAVVPLDPSNAVGVNVAKGAADELAKLSSDSKLDKLELSLAQPAATNVSAIVNHLKSNPDTEYIILPGASWYTGLKQGLKAAGMTDKVKLVLTFPFETDLQAIKDGEFLASVAGEATQQWRQIDALARLSIDEKIADKMPNTDFRILTPDTAKVEALDPPEYTEAYIAAWGV